MAYSQAEKHASRFRLMHILSDLNDLKDHVPHDDSPKKSLEKLYKRLILQAAVEADVYLDVINDNGVEEID